MAAKAAEEDPEIDETIEFKIGEDTFHAYRPTPGQVVMMFTRIDDLASQTERIAAMIDFFFGCLDTESHRILARKLMDRDDPFEVDNVTEISSWLMEEWGGRPTQPPTVSPRSRRNGGRKSTVNSPVEESTHSLSA